MREGSRLTTFTVFLLLTGLGTVGAQEQQGSVPVEFVHAIVGADAELLIGELPDALADTLPLPDGARVIGSVINERRTAAAPKNGNLRADSSGRSREGCRPRFAARPMRL